MNAISYQEVLSLFQETGRKFQETDRKFQETDRKFQENVREGKETDRRLKDLERITFERGRQVDQQTRQIDQQTRQIRDQGRQIGGLGDKFGYFTEGMALPSMERILTGQFGMTFVMPRVRIRKNGEEMEIDVLAYANDDVNLAMVVEVKSRVKKEGIDQLRRIMERFRGLFPEHGNKAVMGILAGVDWDWGIAEQARETGFLTASIRDEIFHLTGPESFQARRW